MTFQFHPGARVELNEAVDYYEERREGLGQEFFDEVLATIQQILDFPNTWPVHSKNTRSCLTSRFSHRIIYQPKRGQVRIIAVAHQRRRPGYWIHRVEE
jgi:plasmid stabilization system protein ParE